MLLREQQQLMFEQQKEAKREMEATMEAKLEEQRQIMAPQAAISDQQIAALLARVQATHATKLLSDDELSSLEDILADLIEEKARCNGEVVTMHDVLTNGVLGKAHKLIALSQGLAKDEVFVRQLRRKVLG